MNAMNVMQTGRLVDWWQACDLCHHLEGGGMCPFMGHCGIQVITTQFVNFTPIKLSFEASMAVYY